MKLPTDSERIVIAGRTGSGKTTEALFHLSQRSMEFPWIIVNFKTAPDDPIARMPVTAIRELGDGPPAEPGVYLVNCTWTDATPNGPLDRYLLDVLAQGHTGVLIDEGRRMGQQSRGLRTILAEGRSAYVPLIFLTQRPAHVDTFAFSEAEYFQFFQLQHPDDHDRIEQWVPRDRLDFDALRELGMHHSFWYDLRNDVVEILPPCPPFEVVYQRLLVALPRFEDAAGNPVPRRVRV